MDSKTFFDFLLGIPQTVGKIGEWLVKPIGNGIDLGRFGDLINIEILNITPLGLISFSGVAILVGIIIIHIVRLFI